MSIYKTNCNDTHVHGAQIILFLTIMRWLRLLCDAFARA